MAGRRGLYHADPLFAQFGMLKVGDLYRQQLRVHAWRFWRGMLPPNQAAMLGRTGDVHRHATRSARSGLFLATRDHRAVGYRVPKEWGSLSEAERGVPSLAAFKRGSRGGSWRSMVRLSVGCRDVQSARVDGRYRSRSVGTGMEGWFGLFSTYL